MLKLADLANRADFSLGALHVSPARRRIEGPAGSMHVEPLIMQVFVLLVEAKGEVVTRARLFDECWGGVNVGDYSLNRAITMVRRIAAEVAPGAFEIENIPRTGYRLLAKGSVRRDTPTAVPKWRWRALVGVVLISSLGLGTAALVLVPPETREPTALVIASRDGHSAELANDIANTAMATAAVYQTPLRLLTEATGKNAPAEIALKVRETTAGRERRINLTLVSGAAGPVLWTWSKTEPAEQAASLRAQARLAAGSALACAAETRASSGRPPDLDTVKLYVETCSKFDTWTGVDLVLLHDAFEGVTANAPQLRGAWSKLFLSKAEAIEGFPPVDLTASLRRDIANSQAHGIEVPETYIARAAILPGNARFERLQLYEAGLTRYPRSLALLSARSWQLRSVGRMDEAANSARSAVELYPQSPAASAEYVQSLMSSGRLDAACTVLDRAMKFAPEAANLRSARWRLEMRYGDPTKALAVARSGDWVVEPATIRFLEARENPTKDNVDRAIDALMAAYRADPRDPGLVAQALGAFGRTDEAVRFLLGWPYGEKAGDAAEMLFRPHLREVRRDPRFMLIARNFGVTDYWIKSGILPDFCFDPGLPYNCRKALAAMRRN